MLRRCPELASLVPTDPMRLLGVGRDLADALSDLPAPDDDLTSVMLDEAAEGAHYAADHLAVIELDERSLKRIAIGPEWPGTEPFGSPRLAFGVEHVDGWLFGEVLLDLHADGDDSVPRSERIEVGVAPLDTLDFMGPESTRIRAILKMLIAAAYRDLVVPKVRDEHYETTAVSRGPKKANAAKAQKTGQVARVQYLPRRIALRRAERARGGETQRGTVRRYAVGAFTRRLPTGHHRSDDADAFASEIKIPLAENQTVVRPHYRGGTDDDEIAVRHWKSWSALDLLRTRPRYLDNEQSPPDTAPTTPPVSP